MQLDQTHSPIDLAMSSRESRRRKTQPTDGAIGSLAASTVVATLSVSAAGEVLDANARMCELLGVSTPAELRGRVLNGDLLADAAGWRHWQQAQTEGVSPAVTQKLRKPGGGMVELAGDIHVQSSGADGASCYTGIFVEVSQERRLHAAMKRGARMEALASLTSGIAHDVNNLLTVLVGNLYLVGEEVRKQPLLFKKVKAARDAAKRGSELTRRLLSFARGEAVETDIVDPRKVVQGLEPLLRRALGRRITLDTPVELAAGMIVASAAELESAVVNLAINARDAIASQGTVTIGVVNAHLGEKEARAWGLHAGEYVELFVSDDGAGIEPETMKRIFEPFFSTKKDRGGTGLGMSTVRWFAEQAEGAVAVTSEVGKGTTVTMLLPRAADRLAETMSKTMPLSTLPSGVESVLVLAADEALRATMQQMLEMLGYTSRLSTTPNGMFDRLHADQVDLVIVDALSDGGLGVRTLLRRARALKPEVKVIVATGCGDTVAGNRDPGAATLLKPFSLFDFATTVRRILDGAKHV